MMTEEQKLLVENNHNLIYFMIHKMNQKKNIMIWLRLHFARLL